MAKKESPSCEAKAREYREKMMAFTLRRVRNRDAAEDIVQRAFEKASAKYESLREKDRKLAWIYRITRNEIVDYYRAARPEVPLEASGAVLRDERVALAIGDRSRHEMAKILLGLAHRLPQPYREAVVLSDVEGKSLDEISRIAGISLSGAKSRVARGREKLRTLALAFAKREGYDFFPSR